MIHQVLAPYKLIVFLFQTIAVDLNQSMMEEIMLRFPNIGQYIFKELNDEDFCKSMEVSQSWKFFISSDFKARKDLKERIQDKIQSLIKEIDGFWEPKPTPFHLAAKRGYLPVYQQMMENANDKNPKDGTGMTPLHHAAQNGHLSLCQLIVENIDDKNPKDYRGRPPLHLAARNGHLSVCELVVENVDVKNPRDNLGLTPLSMAKNAKIKNLIQDAITKQY